jgi:hypothetical protein
MCPSQIDLPQHKTHRPTIRLDHQKQKISDNRERNKPHQEKRKKRRLASTKSHTANIKLEKRTEKDQIGPGELETCHYSEAEDDYSD